jgi:diamine N-acetyltransferase
VNADPNPTQVSLREVTADNWRACTRVTPFADHQAQFVQTVAYYLNLCHYGGVWHPLAITAGDEVVGFVMWAVDDDDSRWVGGFVVDASHQRKGYGRQALRLLVDLLSRQSGCTGIALSYEAENLAARELYLSAGFEETGETEDDEVVARMSLDAARAFTG